ncbi:MAG: fimbrial protein [Azovibrio sp.]
MNAKKTLLALLIAAGPTLAMAANEIRFEGMVTDSTCDVVVNGSATPVVLLPSASAGEVNAAGVAGFGDTAFNVAVSGCTAAAGAGGVNLKTVFTGNVVTAQGDLGNTGTATGVALQITTAAGATTPIDLTTTWTSPDADGIHLAQGATSGNKDYYVRYVSRLGDAVAGTVRGSLQYAIVYP